jgi:hypothetical protein
VELVAEVAAIRDAASARAAVDALVQRAHSNAYDDTCLTPFSELCTR